MGKRFPIPAFEYERFKNMEWTRPDYLPVEKQAELNQSKAANGGPAWGAYPVAAPEAFYEHHRLRGDHRHAVMCVLPPREIHLSGRSHAWAIQQALVVDGLDPARSRVLFQWKTPRPMNTRLGPDDGVTFAGGTVFVVCAHRYSDYWLVNRTAVDSSTLDERPGFSVISATEDDINDFHACNLSFSWT